MRGTWLWLAIGIFGIMVPAAADMLTLHNCAQESLSLKTYNEGDGVYAIAREKTSLASCGMVGFTCDGKCKVLGVSGVNYCGTLPRLGEYVIPKGKAGAGEGLLQSPGQVNRWRGKPDWNLVCVCSEAQMNF
jgi:hypothetical protein